MSVELDGSVRHQVVVDLPQDQAFWAFTDLDRIKPREHNLLAVPIEATVLEQHAGGAIYDRGVDGSICRWGRVLTFDPPHSIVFSWGIGPDWQVATDLARTSEVEVTFTAESDGRTRVTLVIVTSIVMVRGGNRCRTALTWRMAGRCTWPATSP